MLSSIAIVFDNLTGGTCLCLTKLQHTFACTSFANECRCNSEISKFELAEGFLFGPHNPLHRGVDSLEGATSDCHHCGQRCFDCLIASGYNAFYNGFCAFDFNFAGKG